MDRDIRQTTMVFRYFDPDGRQLSREQLLSMNVVTPIMEHVLGTVAQRVEKSWENKKQVENENQERYN